MSANDVTEHFAFPGNIDFAADDQGAFSCIIHERLLCLFIVCETMFTIGESRTISSANYTQAQQVAPNRSTSAKLQFSITARSIIIFRRTALPYLFFVFAFSKSGSRNNAKSASQYTVNNNTTQQALKKEKKTKNNVWQGRNMVYSRPIDPYFLVVILIPEPHFPQNFDP